MTLVLALYSHFFHGKRSQKGSDCCLDGTIESRHDNGVTNLEQAVDQNYIDCGTVTLNNFNFKHGALENVSFGEFFAFLRLAHPDQVGDQI